MILCAEMAESTCWWTLMLIPLSNLHDEWRWVRFRMPPIFKSISKTQEHDTVKPRFTAPRFTANKPRFTAAKTLPPNFSSKYFFKDCFWTFWYVIPSYSAYSYIHEQDTSLLSHVKVSSLAPVRHCSLNHVTMFSYNAFAAAMFDSSVRAPSWQGTPVFEKCRLMLHGRTWSDPIWTNRWW